MFPGKVTVGKKIRHCRKVEFSLERGHQKQAFHLWTKVYGPTVIKVEEWFGCYSIVCDEYYILLFVNNDNDERTIQRGCKIQLLLLV